MSLNEMKTNCCVSLTDPLVFDDTLTLLEKICLTIKKLNEVIIEVNDIATDMEDFNNKIEEINATVDQLEIEFNEFKIEINSTIDTKFTEIYDTLVALIENRINTLRLYIDNQVAVLNNRINNIEAGAISVYDPTTGLYSPIQIVINNLYDTGRTDAITAEEFDDLELTATAFDAYEITAIDFDTKAKIILA